MAFLILVAKLLVALVVVVVLFALLSGLGKKLGLSDKWDGSWAYGGGILRPSGNTDAGCFGCVATILVVFGILALIGWLASGH